jgi:hypothetical protein
LSFAEKTHVPVERSEAEIKRMVLRYGASEYMSGQTAGRAVVGFKATGRLIRFELDLEIDGADGSPQEPRPRLNPDFVEALMGFPPRMERLRCLGNGVVPAQAARAFRLLCERLI